MRANSAYTSHPNFTFRRIFESFGHIMMTDPVRAKGYVPRPIRTPALVADVELTGPLAPLTLGGTYRAARLLVRLHGCPIGYADVPADQAEPIDRDRILATLDSVAI